MARRSPWAARRAALWATCQARETALTSLSDDLLDLIQRHQDTINTALDSGARSLLVGAVLACSSEHCDAQYEAEARALHAAEMRAYRARRKESR